MCLFGRVFVCLFYAPVVCGHASEWPRRHFVIVVFVPVSIVCVRKKQKAKEERCEHFVSIDDEIEMEIAVE
jgi:hypothetical protein